MLVWDFMGMKRATRSALRSGTGRGQVRGHTRDFNEIMALAVAGSGTGIWDRDVVTGEIRYSDGWVEILGYRPDEVSTRVEESYDRVHPDDLAYVQATMDAHFEGRTDFYEAEYRLRCRDGGYKWVLSRGRVVSRDARGRALRMVGTTTDISSMRALAERLQQSIELITNLTNQVPGLVFQCLRAPDGTAHMPYASARIDEIYELTAEQVAVSTIPVHERVHPDDLETYRATLAAAAATLTPWHCVFRVLLPEQGLRWRQIDAHPTGLPDGGTLWYGLVVDVTARRRMEQELHALARVDHLTGLPNRRAFTEGMERAWQMLRGGVSRGGAVLMIDIDRFKTINDRYGHAAGDAVLRHVATVLMATLRATDFTGRMGGEEFAACLPDTGLDEAGRIAERLRQAIAGTPVPFESHSIALTVSIGISKMRLADAGGDDALSRADMALYSAKENGRDRVAFATLEVERG
ncbi:sensor domain-containing diguanylate cyclase [Gluconacetobacter diazotrophicus]|uniref:Putative signalling protein, GGDEF family n=1 Tax=Gluconacetobacter diazotrophicus (strain ATCC 49037 / DSM 5601 / CCUG 37298 / CIP 103539 / LMG 7603 / PAl5) TaxID=272568 RepID=A9H718_GLUDA|nr:sensor domain-containing diguanylate cyclase [Gluconacetobacter diazotrophicus]CAP57583.1 putative signalling protein, GGDEF family [Gluconacetobacter diazotrophicus PA1 5]